MATIQVVPEKEFQSLSQWQLMKRRFFQHKLAVAAMVVLIFFYATAIFCEFIAPYKTTTRNSRYLYAPPQRIRFIDNEGNFSLRPFVYGYKKERDPVTWQEVYTPDPDLKLPIYFFVKGEPYRLFGLFDCDIHLFGIDRSPSEQMLFLLGSDELGRDLFSRVVYGTRISLSIGLIGVFLSLALGLILGGISAIFGGAVDFVIQRIIEIILSIPQIPLWMALSAALPASWSPLQIYFAITVVLSLVTWTNVARIARGKFLSIKESDFVSAARSMGASEWWNITRHLIPNFMSYILVQITLGIPGMILGETSLSFLGVGLRAPIVSWGVLLQQAQKMQVVAMRPWLLLPAAFVVVAVLSFNFVGDGLRDAADPHS